MLMEESVLSLIERVDTCVGLSPTGGGRRVYRGSQSIECAVVRLFAIARSEDDWDRLKFEDLLGVDCAVVVEVEGRSSLMYYSESAVQCRRPIAKRSEDLRWVTKSFCVLVGTYGLYRQGGCMQSSATQREG